MAVFLSPVGGVAAQFFTNNGVPLSGGKLYTYAAGTTTPAATYTSSSGVTAHANPIVLDSGGRVPGGETWLTDGTSYKFLLKDSTDVLLATYDNIVGINSNFVNFFAEEEVQVATAGQTVFTLANPYVPGGNTLSVFVDGVNQYSGSTYSYVETSVSTVTFDSGLHVGALVKFTTVQSLTSGQQTDASLVIFTGFNGQIGNVQNLADNDGSDWIGFLPSGTGAVAESVQEKLRQIVSVLDFGAVGDGTTDDYAAIVAALVAADKKTLWFPYTGNTYKFGTNLTIPSGVNLCFDQGAKLSPVSTQTITYSILFGQPATGMYCSGIQGQSTVSETLATTAQFGAVDVITCGNGAWPLTRVARYIGAQTGGTGTEQALGLNVLVQQNSNNSSARLCGIEVDLNNNLASAIDPTSGSYSESTAKYGMVIINGGQYNVTAALSIENFNPGTERKFYRGVWLKDRSIVSGGYAFHYEGDATVAGSSFIVSYNGKVAIGNSAFNGMISVVGDDVSGLINLHLSANLNHPIFEYKHAYCTGAQTATMGNFRRADGTVVGAISSTVSATTYGTSSDYRLKDKVEPLKDAWAVIDQLRPVSFNWKVNNSAGRGFIAHELQQVVPEAVIGEKDAVDENGQPHYQTVDVSFVVPMLVKAVQELKAEFEAYKVSHP
jgi:hypothetical protein